MKLLNPSGGYRLLDSFNLSTLIYLETIRFCQRFLTLSNDPKGRLYDQMVQAARSGRANILEGSDRAATSKETEIKLTDVARASLSELRGDYEIWLLSHQQIPWPKTDPRTIQIEAIRLDRPKHFEDPLHESGLYILEQRKYFASWFDSADAQIVANTLLILCDRAIRLLTRQLETLSQRFAQEGGFREKMTRVRLEAREAASPTCPICEKPMTQRTAKSDGKPFWGCTSYPSCTGTRPYQA